MKIKCHPYGSNALIVHFKNAIEPAVNESVWLLYFKFKSNSIKGVLSLIPAYASLVISYDTNVLSYHSLVDLVQSLDTDHSAPKQGKLVKVPVCYDEAFGLDLEELSFEKRISIEEIVSLHLSKTYQVFMLGFLPGFAFLGKTDPLLETGRKPEPRLKVHAGSVGLAGIQTGVYPLDSPGGWKIIGRSPVSFFDLGRKQPSLLQPGDEVQFYSIERKEFDEIKKEQSC